MWYSWFVFLPGCAQNSMCINIRYHRLKSYLLTIQCNGYMKFSIKKKKHKSKTSWKKTGIRTFLFLSNCFNEKSQNAFCNCNCLSHHRSLTINQAGYNFACNRICKSEFNFCAVLYLLTKWLLLQKHDICGIIYSLTTLKLLILAIIPPVPIINIHRFLFLLRKYLNNSKEQTSGYITKFYPITWVRSYISVS